MKQQHGYSRLSTLTQTRELFLGRAMRQSDQMPVILTLLPSSTAPSRGALRRFRHAYDVARRIESPAILRPTALEQSPEGTLMVCEDFAGEPLRQLMGGPMPVHVFLPLAVALTNALEAVHKNNVIHKGLTPESILVDRRSGAVKLTHFDLASLVPRELPPFASADLQPNELEYVSPEQTGRTNRLLDERSDYYTLGVIFYELLTGRKPFSSTDPLALVHAHIAKVPPAPAEIDASIPAPVSEIVMKLLAKMAEDRYQSLGGLRADLARCQDALGAGGSIARFDLDRAGGRRQLHLSQKLFGRRRELQILLQAFDRVCEGTSEVLFVTGYSGVGKSVLVHELHKPLTARRGRFVSGKFEQLRRDVPYSAIGRAFEELASYFLTRSDDELDVWRSRILDAVGSNGQLLVDIVPSMEAVLGKQPPLAPLDPAEALGRLHYVFRRFVATVARKDHPLTLFLDDLQWADAGSLGLLEELVSSAEEQCLLVIGAFRDNEVDASHPLSQALTKIAKSARFQSIRLQPLLPTDLAEWLADSLGGEPAYAAELAAALHEKTWGNPFFAIQLLTSLFDDGQLAFDPRLQAWTWDTARVRDRSVSANVVDMLTRRMGRLPPDTQRVLGLAACLGHRFAFSTLARVYGASVDATMDALWPAMAEGYLVQLDDSRAPARDERQDIGGDLKFSHDRTQQAAYALVADDRKSAEHVRIGRLLAESLPADAAMFDIATHLNGGRDALRDRNEKLELAELNLRAARRATRMSDHATARSYFRVGTELLEADTDVWRTHRALAFALVCERAHSEYLLGAYDECDALVRRALANATCLEERLAACTVRVKQYFAQARFADAFEASRSVLEELEVQVPSKDRYDEVFRDEFERLRELTSGVDLDALFFDRLATTAAVASAFDLLGYLCLVAYFVDVRVFRLLVLQAVRLWLRHGYSASSSTALVWYGNVLATSGEYEAGRDVGLVGVKASKRFGTVARQCQDVHLFSNLVQHWTTHLRHTLEGMREAHELGVAAGELQWAGYSWAHCLTYGFYLGTNLDEVLSEADAIFSFLRKVDCIVGLDIGMGHYLPMMDLAGRTPTAASFEAGGVDANSYVEDCRARQTFSALAFHYIALSCVYLLYDMPAEGMRASLEAEKHLGFIDGMAPEREHAFYQGLLAASLLGAAPPEDRARYAKKLDACVSKMRGWARICPENCEHKLVLMEAERGRVSGKGLELIAEYERAAELARASGFLQVEALAQELAANFLVQQGRGPWALRYAHLAREAYARWGAARKVVLLEARFPDLAPRSSGSALPSNGASLDAMTIVKAQHAISSEIVLDKLLETMMRIVLESAGARRGCLIVAQGSALEKVADAEVEGDTVRLERTPLDRVTDLPTDILRYVQRTLEPVLLDDASTDRHVFSGEYLARAKARSVYCLPLVRQGKLLGLLYLENNLATKVFTQERRSCLQQIAMQAAISLENASLFAALERENAERRRAEEALSRSTREIIDLYDHAPCGYQSVDENGTFVQVNETALKWLGYTRDEIVGKLTFRDIITPASLPAIEQAFARFKEQGSVRDLDLEYVRKDGTLLPLVVSADAIYDDAGHFVASRSSFFDITARKRVEQELRRERERVAAIMEASPVGVVRIDRTGQVVFANAKAAEAAGVEAAQMTRGGAAWKIARPDAVAEAPEGVLAALARSTDRAPVLCTIVRPNGERVMCSLVSTPLFDDRGEFDGGVFSIEEVSERQRLEEALRQSSKLESVGRLAGGIAHDFNNLLTVILGTADMLLNFSDVPAEAREPAREIAAAANRAADLTRQLLAFSRKQVIQPRTLSLGARFTGIEGMIRRLIGENIELVTRVPGECGCIHADPAQIDQVIVNLAVNARDAMPKGGRLTIDVREVEFTAADAAIAPVGAAPGRYVMLSATDTGSGMDETVRRHLFEPFFTTKEVGKGTGLGLATVYGIVKQASGHIEVESEVGKGTTFRLYFPWREGEAPPEPASSGALRVARGGETVLLVEDEPMLHDLALRVLRDAGYSVLSARNGVEALRVVAEAGDRKVDLVVTDVVMPHMGGPELVEHLVRDRPELSVIYMSGYDAGGVAQRAADGPILEKPFTTSALTACVRKVLDRRGKPHIA